MALNLIVLGPPGAGKGTQAERFARAHGIPKISTGDILREAVQAGTELGRRAKAIMDRGELVSDDVVIGIVRERLERDDVQKGFVLDGFPRTVSQAVELDRLMDGRPPLIVVDIVVPDAELIRRMSARRVCQACGHTVNTAADRCPKCGGPMIQRSDDNEATVRERLKVYARQTKPLVEYYQSRPTFRSIDGSPEPDAVATSLVDAIHSAAHGVKGVRS